MNTTAQPTVSRPGEPHEAHLRDYWKILWQGRFTALAIFVTIVALSMLQVFLASPIYEGNAVIEIKPEARRILPGQEQWVGAEGGNWLSEEKYFNTQLEVLKSRDVAARVFRQLHLQDHPQFRKLSNPVDAFAGLIQVRPKVNTRLVTLSVRSADPREAADWANAVAETYVRRNVDEAIASFRAIMDEIQRGLSTFRTNLGEADVKRMKTAADAELYVPENRQEILKQSLVTYNDGLAKVRVDNASMAAEIDNLDRILREGGDLMVLPRVAQDHVVQSLNQQKVDLERQLESLSTDKKPRHPEVLAKLGELESINGKIRTEVGRIAEELRTAFVVSTRNEDYLKERIQEAEQQAYSAKQASTPYEMQKDEAESKRKVYDVVAETMERLTMGAQLISMNNNVYILDKAVAPRAPIRPRKLLTLAFGLLVGLLMSVGTVLFLDYLDNTFRSPEDIEQFLGLQILGIIPRYRDQDSNPVKEAFQSLRTSILFSSQGRKKNVILFTSAGPQEGKSSTVTLTGRALASAGDRVLILDCDLRRPTQHERLGISREPGITNYLLDAQEGDYARFLQATDVPTLKLFSCGTIPPNPVDLIGLNKFADLLAKLKRDFDWVVVDSPPIASLADSVVLASMVDMMGLIIKHNENDRDLIRRSLKRLRDVRANVFGAVLNSVDLERTYYGDYYYTGYYYEDGHRKKGRDIRRAARSEKKGPPRKVAL